MQKYTVRFEFEITAATPENAAVIARDMLLDEDVRMHADVFPMRYNSAAEDYFPTEEHGWFATFESSVRPEIFCAWDKR